MLLVLAAVLAIADWLAVAERLPHRLRALTKPATMVALIGAAWRADTGGAVHTWMVVGLVLSLAGDIFLMLPEQWFVAGLGAFLLAHVAYIVAMAQLTLHPVALVVAAVVIGAGWVIAGRGIVAGATAKEPKMQVPVALYVTVISAMVAVALLATGHARPTWWLPAAAVLFYASDAILGTNRFVRSQRWMPVAVMVTYHLAQAGFVGFVLTR